MPMVTYRPTPMSSVQPSFTPWVSAIRDADADTLTQLRQFLLNAMFPSMPDTVRAIVQPRFALVTLELARSIAQLRDSMQKTHSLRGPLLDTRPAAPNAPSALVLSS